MTARFLAVLAALFLAGAALAQTDTPLPPLDAPLADAPAGETGPATPINEGPRAETGGAQTLEDILRRQQGLKVDDSFRSNATGDPDSAAGITQQLGTLGGASDAEVYRALRYGTADVIVSSPGVADRVVMQDRGMWWLEVREGPLSKWGGYALLGMLAVLVLFYLVRGKIRIHGGRSGETIQRFNSLERFSHWLLAGSFILLGLTGLVTLFGRKAIGLLQSADNPGLYETARAIYAPVAQWALLIHNNVSWAFMLALVMVLVLWVFQNLPDRTDLKWFAQGGGLLSDEAHPPAKKFNAGQKLIFWAVIVLGGSISASGLSLLFPFELPMFAFTFEKLNALGVPGLLGMEPYPTQLAPHEEMQFAQLWHAIAAFALMTIIIAHIYLGSVGMEGAFDAMGDGQVDKQWAKEHHSLWVEEVEARQRGGAGERPTPAE